MADSAPIFPRYIRVEDSSNVGEARRLAAGLCRSLGFDETRSAQAALIATELASNIVKHAAGGGDLILRAFEIGGATGIDILALDRGPGMLNVGVSLRDGHSTAGSAGTGLGAIRRLSAAFDLSSAPGQGCAVFSRLWQDKPPAPAAAGHVALNVAAVCLPVTGEQACGDAWAMRAGGRAEEATSFMLADGLGHGPDAACAANLAVAIFAKNALRSPGEILHLIHEGLHGSRGAAVAVAQVSGAAVAPRIVRYAGVGNICGLILCGAASHHLASYNGTAGLEVHKIEEFVYPWPQGGTLVLHSDGVATHWALQDYPGLAQKHPALIAGVLFRDFQRPRDDSTVLVAKESAGNAAAAAAAP